MKDKSISENQTRRIRIIGSEHGRIEYKKPSLDIILLFLIIAITTIYILSLALQGHHAKVYNDKFANKNQKKIAHTPPSMETTLYNIPLENVKDEIFRDGSFNSEEMQFLSSKSCNDLKQIFKVEDDKYLCIYVKGDDGMPLKVNDEVFAIGCPGIQISGKECGI